MSLSYFQRRFSLRNLLLIATLYTWVLIVNLPILQYDFMYPEQPMLYLVNQQIHSLKDLWHIYWHPQLLDMLIPFYRPSGHFLMYQLLMPWFGWHNTQGLLMVNLLFLALTGWAMVRLYALLFPGRRLGGYLAFGLYAIQPALIVSRLTVMHFEFAYVFFATLAMLYFVRFCQANTQAIQQSQPRALQHMAWLAMALLAFCVGVTFKEPALMTGPVLVAYLFLQVMDRRLVFLRQRVFWQLSGLVTIITLALTVYLTASWPGLGNPGRAATLVSEMLGTLRQFTHLVFSLNPNHASDAGLLLPGMILRSAAVPLLLHVMTWLGWAAVVMTIVLMKRHAEPALKSMVFLILAFMLFLVLPVCWGVGFPWHLSLSLLCLNLLMGVSVEYLFCERGIWVALVAGLLLISLAGWQVNNKNIANFTHSPSYKMFLLNRNAVLHPPVLPGKLDAQSVLVVEDSLDVGDYGLGNSAYPFFSQTGLDYNAVQRQQRYFYLRYQLTYNGTLFRWAYLMPTLQEEVYPFQISQLALLPDETIYHWLQQFDHLFCVGYDRDSQWHDRTAAFKAALRVEQARRHVIVNPYRQFTQTYLSGHKLYDKRLPLPDPQHCQLICDQDHQCQGFSYLHWGALGKTTSGCEFYRDLTLSQNTSCAPCTGYLKAAAV